MILKRILIVFLLTFSLFMPKAYPWSDGSGWATYPYIVKILYENIQRYKQLKFMIGQAKGRHQYMKLLNQGINNAVGLMQALPLKDEKVIQQFKDFSSALKKLDELYGIIPKSDDAGMQNLHDRTIAESLKIANAINGYVSQQEKNALAVHAQSQNASPKGAARINAQTNAQILHSLNQLIKVNGQLLKLQSENFAFTNKKSKDSSESFNKTRSDLKSSMKKFETNTRFPKF